MNKKLLSLVLVLALALSILSPAFCAVGYSTGQQRQINHIYSADNLSFTELIFPGNRGPNQLIIYERGFGKSTGTNEYGIEAIVKNNMVVKISGANSPIPNDGYVISGHGSAKKWIIDNIQVGTKISIDKNSLVLTAYTDDETYVYGAEIKIREAEDFIRNANLNKYDNKQVKDYLKKAKQNLKKAQRTQGREAEMYAKEAIKLSWCALSRALPYREAELKGVWVRPLEGNRQEVSATLSRMQKIGITDVFLETFYHGKTIFPSDTMEHYGFEKQNPRFQGFDPLAVWIDEAHKRKIRVHTWFESFYIGNNSPASDSYNILSVKPSWGNKNKMNYQSNTPVAHTSEHNGYFLDPANPEVTGFLKDLIYEISAKYDIDGVNLDYARYPTSAKPDSVSYERTNWGYTNYARNEFQTKYITDPIDIKPKTQEWRLWNEYRQNKITSYVADISDILKNRNVLLSAVIFPLQENNLEVKQQNWAQWSQRGYVDAVTPLVLTTDYELSEEMVKGVKRNLGSKTSVYIGSFIPFMQGEDIDLIKQIHLSRNEKLDGIVIFDWAHMTNEYGETLQDVFTPSNNDRIELR